jgi:imidazolonepropionase
MKQWDLLFDDFQLLTATSAGEPFGRLEADCLAVANGNIAWIGVRDSAERTSYRGPTIEGDGRALSPGLIDCHTHLVFGGDRASEWEARLGGQSYEQIAKSGGGILSTVRATRAATADHLYASARGRVERLMHEGVTTVEIKSGYGLDLASELKILEVGRDLALSMPIDISLTLLAAHAVPPEFTGRADAYIDLVCEEIIPAAAELCHAVDAFCESIAFSWPQCERVFAAAQRHGLGIKIHAEQLTHTGSAAAAARRGAWSADHLERLAPEEASVLAESGTVAVLLPGAYYFLGDTQPPPIAALRDAGATLAVATDCNPGSSPVHSLLLMANMACTLFRLTPAEVLAAITLGAARALRREKWIGSLEVGKWADLVVWDIASPAELAYNIAANPCREVYKRGERVLSLY